jgi:hypothetical protein
LYKAGIYGRVNCGVCISTTRTCGIYSSTYLKPVCHSRILQHRRSDSQLSLSLQIATSPHSANMQRQPFVPTQKSPELFHPRPQHISQVPMMRSPPPPASQSASQPQVNSYGNPYQSPPAGGGGFGQNFNFMNDPTAQMGFQVGQHAMKAGQDYVEQNVC